jgi:hypothetical protein
MTKQRKPSQYDWKARSIEDWNANTFLAYIADNTLERYGVEYLPGGSGSKQQRWARERGMLKQAQERYGNAVLKRFIDICWREYRTTKPEQFPYPTWMFMYSYMDRYFPQAQSEVAAESRRKANEINYEELEEWL